MSVASIIQLVCFILEFFSGNYYHFNENRKKIKIFFFIEDKNVYILFTVWFIRQFAIVQVINK